MKALVINCSPVRDGATAEIGKIISRCLGDRYEVRSICIDDFKFSFCKGCRTCHRTAKCVQHDDVDKIMENYEWADFDQLPAAQKAEHKNKRGFKGCAFLDLFQNFTRNLGQKSKMHTRNAC